MHALVLGKVSLRDIISITLDIISIRGLTARLTLHGTGIFPSAKWESHPQNLSRCKPDSHDTLGMCFTTQWLVFWGDIAGPKDTLRPRGEIGVRDGHYCLDIEEAMGAFAILVMYLYHGGQEGASKLWAPS